MKWSREMSETLKACHFKVGTILHILFYSQRKDDIDVHLPQMLRKKD